MLVQDDLGPTLPALVRDRVARPKRLWLIAGGALAVVLVIVGVALLSRGGGLDGKVKLIHRGDPVFNVLYDPSVVHAAKPHAGELMRLEARGHGLRAEIVAASLQLPDYQGMVGGVLPVFAQRQAIDPAGPGALVTEGKARVNDAPGYTVTLRTGPDSTEQIVYLLPKDSGVRDGVTLTLRQTRTGNGPPTPRTDAAKDFATTVKSAFRSFRYGTARK